MKSSLSWMLFVNIENHKKFIAHNVKVLLSGGVSMNYGSTLAQKFNSSTNAEMWNVCPTCNNTMLAAVKF